MSKDTFLILYPILLAFSGVAYFYKAYKSNKTNKKIDKIIYIFLGICSFILMLIAPFLMSKFDLIA